MLSFSDEGSMGSDGRVRSDDEYTVRPQAYAVN